MKTKSKSLKTILTYMASQTDLINKDKDSRNLLKWNGEIQKKLKKATYIHL